MNLRPLTLLLPLVLAACASTQIYEISPTVTDRAHVRVEFRDESILSGVVRVDRRTTPHQCEGGLQNPLFIDSQKLVVVSRGNPLLSDLNLAGAWIPAGEKATLAIMSLRDSRSCMSVVSFDSVKDRQYVLHVGAPGSRDPHGMPCPLQLVELGSPTGDSSNRLVTLDPVACVPNEVAKLKRDL